MNSGFRNILRRAASTLVLLAASSCLVTMARAQQPPAGAPAGAPRQSHAKPGTTAPTGAPIQSAPAHATPLAGSISPAIHPLPSSASVVGRKTPSGEQFFIVASIDLQKSQLLLKYPTEVTPGARKRRHEIHGRKREASKAVGFSSGRHGVDDFDDRQRRRGDGAARSQGRDDGRRSSPLLPRLRRDKVTA